MKLRTALHLILGLLAAIALVYIATTVVVGPGTSIGFMIEAHRHTPILWIVDVFVVGLVAGMWWFAVMSDNFKQLADHQAQQHHEQLSEMIERTLDLEEINDSYSQQIERLESEVSRRFKELADQIAALESAAEARHSVFELESRRIAERSHREIEGQLDTNTGQVEAMAVALQFHRGELRRLRQQVRELQLSAPPRLSLPPEYDAQRPDSRSQTSVDTGADVPDHALNGQASATETESHSVSTGADQEDGPRGAPTEMPGILVDTTYRSGGSAASSDAVYAESGDSIRPPSMRPGGSAEADPADPPSTSVFGGAASRRRRHGRAERQDGLAS